MGFIWDVYEEQWQRILKSHVYKELHGNLEVPREFAVPSEAPWPEDAWGIKLGSRVVTIRNQECHVKDRPDRVAELNRMGFIWNINEEHWQRILDSLLRLQGAARRLEGASESLRCRQRRRGPRMQGITSALA